jgi:PhnB protein
MPSVASHIPENLSPLIPQFIVKNAMGYIEFLKAAFDAKAPRPPAMVPGGGGVMHAQLNIEGQAVFVGDPMGGMEPLRLGICLFVKDCDAVFERAKKAGAKVLQPPAVQPWGDRWCLVEDPAGNQWQIATHVEDVPPDEIMKRMEKMMKQGG